MAAIELDEKVRSSEELIRHHVYAAVGSGLIPLPFVDLIGVMGTQLNMLRKLSEVYEVPFKKDLAKSGIGALLGSISSVALAGPLGSGLKMIPLIGSTAGALSMSISGGAATYAIGKVFLQHFASGGTFLDFNPASVREYFAEQFKDGKIAAQAARK